MSTIIELRALQNRVANLEEENAILREENAWLRGDTDELEAMVPLEWKLTMGQRRVLALLVQRERVLTDQIIQYLYGVRGLEEPNAPEGVIRVHIHRLRRVLRPLDIEIRNYYGAYGLSQLDRRKLLALVNPSGLQLTGSD